MSIPLALCASTIDNNNIETKKINKLKKESFTNNKIVNMKNAIHHDLINKRVLFES